VRDRSKNSSRKGEGRRKAFGKTKHRLAPRTDDSRPRWMSRVYERLRIFQKTKRKGGANKVAKGARKRDRAGGENCFFELSSMQSALRPRAKPRGGAKTNHLKHAASGKQTNPEIGERGVAQRFSSERRGRGSMDGRTKRQGTRMRNEKKKKEAFGTRGGST